MAEGAVVQPVAHQPVHGADAVFHEPGVRGRVHSQAAQGDDDLRRALQIGGVPADEIALRRLLVRQPHQRPAHHLPDGHRLPGGSGIRHCAVLIGRQRLQGHGCQIHVRVPYRQAEAALRLLRCHQRLQNSGSGVDGILRHGEAGAVQSDQAEDPAVESLCSQRFGGGELIYAVGQQVHRPTVLVPAEGGGVRSQRQRRQGGALPLRGSQAVQAPPLPVHPGHIALQCLAVSGGIPLRTGPAHGDGHPVADGVSRRQLVALQQCLRRAALRRRQRIQRLLPIGGNHYHQCQQQRQQAAAALSHSIVHISLLS